MKRFLMVFCVTLMACTSMLCAQTAEQKLAASTAKISLADARSRIDKAIEKPAVMRALMRLLPAEDQKQFLADVNKAISDMPASVEEKAAKFVSVNMAALGGAAKGNATTLIAEVFATVPPEHLMVVQEKMAEGPLNRNSMSGLSDADVERIATKTMQAIVERCNETDNGSPRAAMAIVMFNNAANGTMPELADKLIDNLASDEAKELARSEWIPSALGRDGREKSADPILASADAGRRPDRDFTLVITAAQYPTSVISDILGGVSNPDAVMNTRAPGFDAAVNVMQHTTPTIGADVGDDVREAGKDPEQNRGGDASYTEERPKPPDDDLPPPGPYQWQNM